MTMSDASQPVLWGENLVKSHDGARRQLDDASLVLRVALFVVGMARAAARRRRGALLPLSLPAVCATSCWRCAEPEPRRQVCCARMCLNVKMRDRALRTLDALT